MIKINNWESIQDFSEVSSLPIGPQLCRITKVTDFPNKSYLWVEFEIMSGQFKGWYKSLEERTHKWYGFIVRSYKDSALGFFKAFITAVEKSNPGYKWDWNEKSLVGKDIVVNYREEESIYNDEITRRVRPFEFRSIPALKEGKVDLKPEPLELSDTEKDNFEMRHQPAAQTTSFDEIADDGLPF